jgi:hypothetical protein
VTFGVVSRSVFFVSTSHIPPAVFQPTIHATLLAPRVLDLCPASCWYSAGQAFREWGCFCETIAKSSGRRTSPVSSSSGFLIDSSAGRSCREGRALAAALATYAHQQRACRLASAVNGDAGALYTRAGDETLRSAALALRLPSARPPINRSLCGVLTQHRQGVAA